MSQNNNKNNQMDVSNDKDFVFDELRDLAQKLEQSKDIPEDLREKLERMLRRLNRMAKFGTYSSEFETASRYIEVVASIPWQKRTRDNLDLENAKEMLDSTHYGMGYVKDRIIEYLATMILIKRRGENAISKSPVLLLVGLQGVGKTTLAMSIASALGREFVRIAMGAIGSVLELRGRSKAYANSEPGQIIKALIKTNVKNPVILLDEIDKASGQEALRADIMATLLEVLDPNQNPDFRDHYVDHPFNLSDVMFICSANNTGNISTALMDRMEVIKMPSYTNEEKIVIARDFVLPRVIENTGLEHNELRVDPNLWPDIVRPFGYDSGIRSIERILESMCRKVARVIVEGKSESVQINLENLKFYLPK